MTVELLSVSDIKERIASRQLEERKEHDESVAAVYKYIKPLSTAAEDLIEVTQNVDGRMMLGVRELDINTRGFGRGELIIVTGRAGSGKTQVLLNMLSNNAGANVLWFTPDEPAPLVLSKLASIHYGVNGEDIERRIKDGDKETIAMVRRVASNDFANTIVIDDSLTLNSMSRALEEAQDYWGAPADLVVVDYLELIPGDNGATSDGVVGKAQALKRWCKNSNVPVVCLHQSSRSSGPRGTSAGMNSGKFGTEQEAIMLIEVFRKREDESLDEWQRLAHQNQVTVALVKNKRPPSKLCTVDLYMDPHTGAIRSLRDEDMAIRGSAMTTVNEAFAAQENHVVF